MTDSGELNPFRELSTEQLISKRLDLHADLGSLLLEQAELKANPPRVHEAGDTSYMDRYIEVDDAINLCVSSIPQIRSLLRYFDIDISALEKEMYAAPVRPEISLVDPFLDEQAA